jgi:branched-chain amino acid transport system ATP-binding protein
MSVRENVMLGAYSRERPGFLGSAGSLRGVTARERRLRAEADEALARMRLTEVADHPAAGLPYGTLKRVELARAVFQRPRLLLLDEPASGLNHSEVGLLVEHNMGMVMDLCEQVVVLDLGQKIAEGEPREVQEHKRVIEAYLGAPA